MNNGHDILNLCNATKKIPVKTNDLYYSNLSDLTTNVPEVTIPKMLLDKVKQFPNDPVLKYKSGSKSDFDMTITMQEYLDFILKAAKSFITLGLKPKASIGIIGFNHPAWFISELGGIFAGGMACGIYTTNNADMCKFIINDCNCQVMVVENDEQLEKILSILPDTPQIKAIIQYTGDISSKIKNGYKIPILTWTQFLSLETSDAETELKKRMNNLHPKDCALLIYTSGTTGFPKGVMLSHDNIIFTFKMVIEHLDLSKSKHSVISYLPLSHVAANMIDIISTISLRATVYFAEPDALKGSLGKTLTEVRPTLFIAVPRVFEKIHEQLEELKNRNKKKKENDSTETSETKDFQKIKKALGLDRCEYIASAAAPISISTLEYFLNLDITIHQVYGMSECCGPETIGTREKMKIGSVGTLMKGVELKISDPDENLIGEVCMRGRHVFIGYFNAEEKTREAIDSDRWLHSGDLGKMDEDGFLTITGRIKELIVTAGGENIAPVPIEEKIKEELLFINHAMVVGDKRKFLSCLLTIKTELNPEKQIPNDTLTSVAIRSLKEHGINATKVEHVLDNNKIVKTVIDEAIKKVNSTAVSKAAYIQKWVFLPQDFSINGGELGPTLKLKRPVVSNMYADLIDSLYNV